MRLMVLALLAAAAPAVARSNFEAYDGPLSSVVGQGGTKVTANGIDYWTTGSPPRRFKLLGVLVDDRGSGPLAGDVVGSKKIARRVKELGGDAVIIGGSKETVTGAQVLPSYGVPWAAGGARINRDVVTRVGVIKYLE